MVVPDKSTTHREPELGERRRSRAASAAGGAPRVALMPAAAEVVSTIVEAALTLTTSDTRANRQLQVDLRHTVNAERDILLLGGLQIQSNSP